MSEKRTLWGLRVFALALAVMAWALISFGQRERFSETQVEPLVQFSNIPSNLIQLSTGQQVSVRLRGPVSRMASINPAQINAVVDLRDFRKGTNVVELASENIVRPAGIDVVAVEPGTLSIDLDERVTELRPVDPLIVGEPAAGAVVKTTSVIPRQVAVTGPESLVSIIEKLSTRPVPLDGHAIDFEEETVVPSPDPLVQVLRQVVTVRVVLEVPGAESSDEAGQDS
ncbi:MAG: CdaR family protein [Acidobacteriota bacterium]|nr:CdaR family protein [Acidobacteriota bacterium]